jgi:hypothetical protein
VVFSSVPPDILLGHDCLLHSPFQIISVPTIRVYSVDTDSVINSRPYINPYISAHMNSFVFSLDAGGADGAAEAGA